MDFSGVCRLCLSEDSLISIFTSNEAEDKRYSTAIFLTSGIKVTENDGLPQKICSLCINYLNESLNYRKKCKEVENKLLEQSISINKEEPLEFEVFYGEPITENTVKTEVVKLKKHYKTETVKLEIKLDKNFDVKDEILDEKINDDDDKEINSDDDEENQSEEKALKYTIDKCSKGSQNSYNDIVLYIDSNDDHFSQDVKKEIEVTTTNEIPVKLKQKQSESDDEQDGDLPYEIDMKAPDQNRVVCKVCRKSLSIRSIDAHISSMHPGKDSRKMQCEICSVFILRHKYNRHMKMMHGIGPEMKTFRCSYCKSEFLDKEMLIAHVASCVKRTKKREPSKSSKELQECDVCQKVMQRGSIKLHKAIKHAGLRPVCEVCTTMYSYM
ncbi:unnamed protein product [Plutella xylostella]|uniref:(diamondback moth) hypothetical protein n=1 Tax=Plutella xylostella TaxID=51655 RepID=A0A8S4FJZ8_PLUXY|nr:unnamed protein product [Plutella xylostella]